MRHRGTVIRLLCAAVVMAALGACAGPVPSVAQVAPAEKLAAQRQAAAVLAVDPSRLDEMSKAALERAYAMRAGDGGAAPPELQASRPVPVVLAVAHPVDAGAVRMARVEVAPVRQASAATPRPGLIKAPPATAAPMVRKVKLEAPKPAAAAPKAEVVPPEPPKAAAAPPPEGTVAKLTRLLRRVLGIGAPG